MKHKLTKQIFIACMVVFVMSTGLLAAVMGNYLAKRNIGELRDKAMFVSEAINAQGWEFLKALPDESDTRITVVDADGNVLYDTMLDAGEMENHGDREEIQEALENGTGDSERYSKSLLRKTANYAVRLNDGSVVRISMVQDTLGILILNMLQPAVLVVLVIVALSVVMAAKFSQNILRPINRLDVENPDDREIYDELKPFISRIMSQNQQIYHQMEELREEHKKQDAMRREFTANVSHELKTPLTSISGFAEIIRDGFVQEKDIPHFADNIYREAQRLMDLVNDILKLSKLEDGSVRVREERSRVEMLELCRDVTARLKLHSDRQKTELVCSGENVEIMGYRGILEEIVYNVCDNAIKYNRPGGWVRVTVAEENGEAVVNVEDNGIGIPWEEQERIFERFYRVNKSHSKEVGGTGLGLSIVKHGVALHGGRIGIESEVGRGTKISLYFQGKIG
jgi:two-component system phosphate regulon sensor histidine kinase PhoR